jgi:hypothetical protein
MADADIEIEDLKGLREDLCVAQSALGHYDGQQLSRIHRIGKLIEQIDIHRPLGPDGKHGNRHTETCGCEDKPEQASLTVTQKIQKVLTDHEAFTVIRYKDNDEDNRVGYQCKCGAEDTPDLWGRDWLIQHQTEKITEALNG